MTTYFSKDVNHLCSQPGTPKAIFCTGNYCLENGFCVEMDEKYSDTLNLMRISRIQATSICGDTKNMPVDKCSRSYCINISK